MACNLYLAQLSTNRTSVHSLKRCFKTDLIRPAQAPIWMLLALWLPFTQQTKVMDKNRFHLPQLQSGWKERMMHQPCQNPKLLTNTSGECWWCALWNCHWDLLLKVDTLQRGSGGMWACSWAKLKHWSCWGQGDQELQGYIALSLGQSSTTGKPSLTLLAPTFPYTAVQDSKECWWFNAVPDGLNSSWQWQIHKQGRPSRQTEWQQQTEEGQLHCKLVHRFFCSDRLTISLV